MSHQETQETQTTESPQEAQEQAAVSSEASIELEAAQQASLDAEQLQTEIQSLKEQNLRLYADYDNLRKRRSQEIEQFRRYGAESTLLELLPVLDNLERAQASLSETSDPKILLQSLSMMKTQLEGALQNVGLQRLKTKGEAFDPRLHEAIARQESSEVPADHVLAEQLPGYQLHDKLLRAAQVVVAAQSEAQPSDASPTEAQPANPFQ